MKKVDVFNTPASNTKYIYFLYSFETPQRYKILTIKNLLSDSQFLYKKTLT